MDTVKSAYTAYVKKNLPMLDAAVSPAQFKNEVEKVYKVILNGGPLPGNEKAGDDEAKVKMHIKTASSAAKVIAQAESGAEQPPAFMESFYSEAQDVILPYLDALKGARCDAIRRTRSTSATTAATSRNNPSSSPGNVPTCIRATASLERSNTTACPDT